MSDFESPEFEEARKQSREGDPFVNGLGQIAADVLELGGETLGGPLVGGLIGGGKALMHGYEAYEAFESGNSRDAAGLGAEAMWDLAKINPIVGLFGGLAETGVDMVQTGRRAGGASAESTPMAGEMIGDLGKSVFDWFQ